MEINAFFDASYYKISKRAVIAIFIEDISINRVIERSTQIVECGSSSEAEFKALCKLVNFLNLKQNQQQLPMDISINLFGDNKEVISCIINKKKSKRICIQDVKILSDAVKTLKANNNTTLMWISRKQNSAHGVLKKHKLAEKANQSWFFS